MLIVLLLIYKAFCVKIRLCGTVKVCVLVHFLLRHIARLLALICSLFDVGTEHLNLFAVTCLFSVVKLGIKRLESVVASVLLVKVLLKHGEVKTLKLNGRVAVILVYSLVSRLFLLCNRNRKLAYLLFFVVGLGKSLSLGKLLVYFVKGDFAKAIKSAVVNLFICLELILNKI